MLKQEESRLVYKLIDLGYAKELGVSDDDAYIDESMMVMIMMIDSDDDEDHDDFFR